MNKRALFLSILSLTAFAIGPSFAQAPPSDLRARTAAPANTAVVLDGAARAEAISAANQALNGIQRLQGRFVQTAPDGASSAGTFYLQRPGRLRFEYDPPASLLIVSDGSVVAMRDTALRTTERTPLRSTPLNLILASQIDLERDARIERVVRSGSWLLITASDPRGQADGRITLHFDAATRELRSWDIFDATGGRTRIALSNLERPASLDRRLFRLEDMLSQRPRR